MSFAKPLDFFKEHDGVVNMRNVAILVDGDFYLKQHRKYFEQTDVEQVAKDLLSHCLKHIYNKQDIQENSFDREQERLYRIFFYDCPPIQKKIHHPLTNNLIDFSKSSTAIFRSNLHKQLKQTRNLALRLGVLDERNARWKVRDPKQERKFIAGKLTENLTESDVVYYAQQKNVDMKIGLDIASISYKRMVNKIVLISGDSDFVPAAKLARREGIEFILDPMRTTIKVDLQEHIDGLNTTLPKNKKT